MAKTNLKRIDLWSIHFKSIVIIATIFFICILGYFLYLRPSLEKKEKSYLNFKASEKELNNQLEITSEYSICQEKIKNIKKQFDIYYKDSIDKTILNVLNGKLATPFFKINKIHILTIKNKKDFLNYLKVESHFFSVNNNIFNFLYLISRLKKLIIIENFKWIFFNVLQKNQRQEIIFSFKIYAPYLNSKNLILVLSKINKPDAKFTSEKNNLSKYSLSKIKMLGFLAAYKDRNWGLVVLPNKQVCKLKLGDYLGLERGIVIGAYAHEILIQDNSLNKIIKLIMDDRKFLYAKNSA